MELGLGKRKKIPLPGESYLHQPGDRVLIGDKPFYVESVVHLHDESVLTCRPMTPRDTAKIINFGVPYGRPTPLLKRKPAQDWNW